MGIIGVFEKGKEIVIDDTNYTIEKVVRKDNSVEMKLLGSRGGIVVVTIPQKSKRKLFDDLVGNLQVLVNAIDTKNVNDGLNKVFSKAQADIESVIDRFKKAAESFKNPVE